MKKLFQILELFLVVDCLQRVEPISRNSVMPGRSPPPLGNPFIEAVGSQGFCVLSYKCEDLN